MSLIRKCDVCGTEFCKDEKRFSIDVWTPTSNVPETSGTFDLCVPCYSKILEYCAVIKKETKK